MGFADELCMGPKTLQISPKLFKENRCRLLGLFRSKCIYNGVVLIQGGKTVPINDSDINYLFRQETYFYWTFGILEPFAYGLLNIENGSAIGFFKRQPEDDLIWNGPIHDTNFYKMKYELDEVFYTDELDCVMKRYRGVYLYLLSGKNSDSGLVTLDTCFCTIADYSVNIVFLFDAISELRVVKTQYEIEVIRYAVNVTSDAHRSVMLQVKPGMYQYQLEAEFLRFCYKYAGCRQVGFTPMCASGITSSILHYGGINSPNDAYIKEGDLCVFDMGAEYFGYTADITCTFPASGLFTNDQALIYEMVLDISTHIRSECKPGVNWQSLHILANQMLLCRLIRIGLLCGEVGDMMACDLVYVFQPHAIGHLLGLESHDVGGYLVGHPPRGCSKSLQTLRTARYLEKGMVLSIGPGCYFISHLLKKAFGDSNLNRFMVRSCIERFKCMGGVRIEDNVLITECGAELLNRVPRTVSEIEEYLGVVKRNLCRNMN